MIIYWSLAVALLAASVPAKTPERRCGWLHNPTPANWWLTDRDGSWILSSQGPNAFRALENLPDMTTRGWVITNGGSYGYGCACLTVEVDRQSKDIVRLHKATPLPLRRCRTDRRLPKPWG